MFNKSIFTFLSSIKFLSYCFLSSFFNLVSELFYTQRISFYFSFLKFYNFFYMRIFNKFFFFADSFNTLSILNVSLSQYIFSRNLKLYPFYGPIKSVYSGFAIFNWNFLKSSNSKIFSLIHPLSFKSYKRILKSLVKASYGSTCLSLIKLLNYRIHKWNKKFKYVSFFHYYALSLDFYLHKLLWKWCKRSHPRRPNSWIFKKYWMYFSGSFKFFFANTFKGRVYFLYSHLNWNNFQRSRKSLSFSLSSILFKDKSKVFYDSFMKLRSDFTGIYGILFDYQRGICPCCNQLFVHSDLKFFRIVFFSKFLPTKKIYFINSNLILIHASCNIV